MVSGLQRDMNEARIRSEREMERIQQENQRVMNERKSELYKVYFLAIISHFREKKVVQFIENRDIFAGRYLTF